jgi:predicted DCC family thiol-disulfide oxidoreductase YuxK
MKHATSVLLFDGHCNLCSGVVQFVLKRDRHGKIKMAALQSEAGKALMKETGLTGQLPDSMILIKGEKYWLESEAAIQLAFEMGGCWKFFKLLRVFPLFLRNAVYRIIARNRYRFFGSTQSCYLPSPDWEDRFL